MSLTAFVTGGTGFVGMNLVRELSRQGWRATLLVREQSPTAVLEGLDIELCRGDLVDAESVAAAMPRNVDCVYHVAASTNVWSGRNEEQTRTNVAGTANVIDAAVRAGARRLVYTSTFVVWGFHAGVIDERSEPIARDGWINYIRTKRLAERQVKDAAAAGRLDATICNPAHVLGPGDRHNWARLILMIARGRLPGAPPGGGNFADVREVARAHVAAYHRGGTGQNYLLGGEPAMFMDVVRMAGEILGRRVPSRPSPAWLLRAAARIGATWAALSGREPDLTPEGAAMVSARTRCDSSRAIRELGYRFTPVRTLVQDTCNWLRAEGLLE